MDELAADTGSLHPILAAAGAPVVYVATGTVVDPEPEQLAGMLGAMELLAGVRVIWSLKKVRPTGCARLACARSTHQH